MTLLRTPIITIDNVSKFVPGAKGQGSASAEQQPILHNVSFQVRAGEIVVVVGGNGAGKSTLLNLIAGLDQPSSGQIRIDDYPISQFSAHGSAHYRNQILGFITQKPSAITSFSLAENVALPLLFNPEVSRTQRIQRYQEAIEQFDLKSLLHLYPQAELSGGQGQRMNIARALINDPVIILADEPTAGLDSAYKARFFEFLREAHAHNKTIIMASHLEDWQPYFALSQVRLIWAQGSGTFVEVLGQHKEKVLAQLGDPERSATGVSSVEQIAVTPQQRVSREQIPTHSHALPEPPAARGEREFSEASQSVSPFLENRASELLQYCEDLWKALHTEQAPAVQQLLEREFNLSFHLLNEQMSVVQPTHPEEASPVYASLLRRYRSLYQRVHRLPS